MPRPSAPNCTALGLAVRELRKQRDLSQEELAHASGLHPTYLSGIERGLLMNFHAHPLVKGIKRFVLTRQSP